MAEIYDIAVIGGGPAGYAAAVRAAKLKKSVILFEERALGGTCLNRGCIPMKSLLRSSQLYFEAGEFSSLGIVAKDIRFDEAAAYLKKDEICSLLRSGVEKLLSSLSVKVINERAEILDKGIIEAGGEKYKAVKILIALGSKPVMPNIKGEERALTSDEVLERPVPTDKIIIIGGGVIGIEFAQYFSQIKKDVTVIEARERILPMFSKEISVQLSSVMRKNGVKFVTGQKTAEILADGVMLESGEKIEAGAVIMAIGRKSNIDADKLEKIGIVCQNGYIKVNDNFETTLGGVYACGDAIGGALLAHKAHAEAICAVEAMLGQKKSIDLSAVPSCVYTFPQIAAVGSVEGVKVGKFLMGANGKSVIDGSDRGFVKIFADEDDNITGAEIFSVNATEIISEIAVAVKNKLKVSDITSVIHPHPTVSEALFEAAEDIYGLATHKAR